MKLLILTCNTGMGHNSTAAAVKEAAELENWQCDITDALAFLSERASEFISSWHVRIYRHAPKLFDQGYSIAENLTALGDEKSLLTKVLASGSDKLAEYIRAGGYKAVLATHNFAASMLCETIKAADLDISTGFVATDYTCAPTTKGCTLQHVFIPHRDLIPEFRANDIAMEKLVVSGIPVKKSFCCKGDRAAARKALGIDPVRPHILMMCGSMGCGPIEELCEELSNTLVPGSLVTAVCGTNEKLLGTLRRKNLPWIEPIGYTDQIPLYMDSADLFLTKPGGISITESAGKALPMVLIDAVGGCEDHNLSFFTLRKFAKTADTPKALAELCAGLLRDKEALEEMAARLEKDLPKNASTTIFRTLAEG